MRRIRAIALLWHQPGVPNPAASSLTVNNGDMIRTQLLTSEFTNQNPGITVEWCDSEENVAARA